MARIDTLGNFLTDVATSIRTKKGTTNKITPKDFDTEIESIQSGGGTPNLQEKSVTITENTTTEIIADSDYDGLSKVSVTTNIPTSSEMFTITNCTYLFQNDYRNDVIDKLLPFCNGTTDTSYMFNSCSKLSTLNLSNFDTSSVINMSYMFNMCSNLTSLDLSSFDFTKVSSYSNMFGSSATTGVPNNCEIIVKDDTAKTWITGKFSRLTNVKTVAEL